MAEKTVGSSFDYVEPLDFNLDTASNKIVYPYEDYSISVNLEVQVPERNSCGNGMNTVLYASSDNGTISFFGGSNGGYSDTSTESEDKEYTKGYLSTSWTDISSSNVDRGNRECLGIESLNITYNQNFFPVVNIRFVDVRGASLFMPQEKGYREAVKENRKATTSINGGSFFKALFSCPSPIFKLTVKGFYGYSATYKLMWTKFTSDFDGENGNFIANVEFAGYLYGIYTDLPMTYVALAPYTEEGSKYWESKKFTFDNNTRIPTFPELYEVLQKYNKEREKINPSSFEGTKLTELGEKIDGLTKLSSMYPFNDWVNTKDNEYYFRELINDEGTHFDLKFSDDAIEKYRELLQTLYAEYPETFEKYKNRFETILKSCHYYDSYDLYGLSQKTSGHVIPECYVFSIDTDTGKILSCELNVPRDVENMKEAMGRNKVSKLTTGTSENVILTESQKQDRIKEFGLDKNTPSRMYKYLYYYVIRTDFLDEIENDLKKLTEEQTEEKNIIYEEKMSNLENLIGYYPSIENLFKMVFAHIETFMHVYYLHLENIKREQNNKDRTLSAFNIGENTLADVPNSFFDAIPPFPNFVKEDENKRSVLQWPEDIIRGEIEETKFVKDLHNSVNQYAAAVQEAQKNIENYSLTSYSTNEFLPLTAYDIITPGNKETLSKNPYAECIRDLNETKGDAVAHLVHKITYIFLVRCYYFALIYRAARTLYNDKPIIQGFETSEDLFKYIGAIEAANVIKAFGERNVPTRFYQILNETIKTIDTFAVKYFDTSLTKSVIVKSINPEKYWEKVGYKIEREVSGVTYKAIPVRDYSIGEVPGKTSTDDFLYVKKDSSPITEVDINDGFVDVIDDRSVFDKISDGIKNDTDYQNFAGNSGDYNKFIDNFYSKYIGEYLTKKDVVEIGFEEEDYDDPYFYDTNKDYNNDNKIGSNIFSYKNEKGTYDTTSFVKNLKGETNGLNLSLLINGKFYTSFINNHPCIDTINVICSGCTSANCHSHFVVPDDKNFGIDALLTTAATPYDKAFLLLFSLPITKSYSYNSLSNNGKSVAKAVLLREGAYYYWKENAETIKPHFNSNYFNRFTADKVPILKVKETIKQKAPTLFAQKGDGDFFTWAEINGVANAEKLPTLTSGRKNRLIKYFKDWVEQYFEGFNKEISTEELATDADIDNAMKVILNPSKISILTKLMTETSILFDASDFIDVKINRHYTTYYYGYIKNAFKFFADNVVDYYKKQNETSDVHINKFQEVDRLSADFYLSTYNTLQSLYNRHIAGSKIDRWLIGNKDCDFNNFLFLDCYYTQIGDSIMIGSDALGELLSRFIACSDNKGEVDASFSVYQYLSLLCQKCEMNLIALPVNPYRITLSGSGMQEVFKPRSFGQDSLEQPDNGCFVALYTYPNSQYPDMEDDNGLYGYKNDSFLIVDNNGNLSSELPIALRDADKRIPAFGVTYAKQNQCFFKKINVSSANPQVTAPSIQAQFNIASRGNDGPNETISYGQDLFSVYSNHSYTCDVEMMGCAQIMPMMYFQLNNIPMFRGVYMVIKVEHNIVAGDMTTKFTGVRMNKNALPLVRDTILFKKKGEPIDYEGNTTVVNPPDYEATWEDNPSSDELENRKGKIQFAFDETFSCQRPGMQRDGQMKGMCSRYTYNIAYAYKKGKTPCTDTKSGSIPAGGNADWPSYWSNLEKLGYKKQSEFAFHSVDEIKKYIKNLETSGDFKYGDVLVYYSDCDKPTGSHTKFHTQIYIGDAKPDECPIGWASSMKNNYGSAFVYGKHTELKNWKLIIFKADGNEIQ